MKIGLIIPRSYYFGSDSALSAYFAGHPSAAAYLRQWSGVGTGLLTVAALTPDCHELELIDENAEVVDFDEAFDLVGITAMTQQATRAYQIADEFKKRGVKVAIGGIHATALPEEAKQHADSVVIGEAEYSWPELLLDADRGNLRTFYRSNRPVDLQDSPMPRYDLLAGRESPIVWLETSRGCPHDCDFCAASKLFGNRYRRKSVAQTVKELRYIVQRFASFRLQFADDNLFGDRRRCMPILERLSELNLRWASQSDISIAEDEHVLRLASRTGCTSLFIGLESIGPEALRGIDRRDWKLGRSSNYAESIKRIQSHGIGVQGAFITGLDSDDNGVFGRLIEFAEETQLFAVQASILTPFPATRVRTRLEQENRILDTPWEDYTGFDVNFIPKKATAQELRNGILAVYRHVTSREFFLRNMGYFKEIHKGLMCAGGP